LLICLFAYFAHLLIVCCLFLYIPTESDPHKSIEKAAAAIVDQYRLAVLLELAQRGELCCLDVKPLTGLAQATCSHHLKLLTESELSGSRKEGKPHFYRLHHENFSNISAFLA